MYYHQHHHRHCLCATGPNSNCLWLIHSVKPVCHYGLTSRIWQFLCGGVCSDLLFVVIISRPFLSDLFWAVFSSTRGQCNEFSLNLYLFLYSVYWGSRNLESSVSRLWWRHALALRPLAVFLYYFPVMLHILLFKISYLYSLIIQLPSHKFYFQSLLAAVKQDAPNIFQCRPVSPFL